MDIWSEASRGFGGKIEDFPLTSVLQILELGRKSGFLYVRQFPKVAFLVFREGGVIQAVSTLRRVGLGELLIAEGLVSREDLDLALSMQQRAPKRRMLGEIFESQGHVTHDQILRVLTNQMKEIVRWILDWKEGEFTFYAGNQTPEAGRSQEEEMVLPVGIVVQEVLQSMLTEEDRRRHPRVPVSIKVLWREGTNERFDYTRDVSYGGLYVLSNQPPAAGATLTLELWIPSMIEPAKAAARVVRVHNDPTSDARGFALEFTQIDEEAQKILERLGTALSNLL